MAKDLTVTVTGPTGDLGVAVVEALEASNRVKRVVGLARRPFDPRDRGWKKTEYREGDVQDAAGVKSAVKGADVVVHLAFSLLGAGAVEKTRAINVEGSRNVFGAAVSAGAERICYASSVAAYGFYDDNPAWLDETVPPRGTDAHPYSRQKAEVERVLAAVLESRPRTAAYVFRPCIVAGPKAQMVMEEIPYLRISEKLPDAARALFGSLPLLKPVIPDAGVRFQLVHEDDVASAFLAGALGKGEPGAYNLAASGTLSMSDLASALGWYSIPVPDLAVDTTAQVIARLPGVPEQLGWIQAMRTPVLMRTDRAQKLLGWRPQHTSRETLSLLVDAHRADSRVS